MGKDIEDMVQSPHQPGWVPGTGGVLLPVVGGQGKKRHCLWTCEPGSRKTLFPGFGSWQEPSGFIIQMKKLKPGGKA